MNEAAHQRMTYEMKFAEKHVERILSGEKRLTARLADEWDSAYDGDELKLLGEGGEWFGWGEVKRARTMTAREAYEVVNLHRSHKSYDSLTEFVEILSGYYPVEDVDAETSVRLIAFEVTDDER